jgi:hypothetical protein
MQVFFQSGNQAVLSQIIENRKVEVRKSLIFRHTVFTFGLKNATLRQNPPPFSPLRHPRVATGYVAERRAAMGDQGQVASQTCSKYERPPTQGRSTSSGLRRRVRLYIVGFTDHGWHHEPHSPVQNAMCKRWDTPIKTSTLQKNLI